MTSLLVMVDITQIRAEHEHKIQTKTKKNFGIIRTLCLLDLEGVGGVDDMGRDGLTKDSNVKLHHGKM